MIEQFSKGIQFEEFVEDRMMQSAIIRQFEIIDEAATNLTDETKKRYPNVEWITVKDFRNVLIHEYFRVDVGEVWSTINKAPTQRTDYLNIEGTLK